jgi:hypothetical protein
MFREVDYETGNKHEILMLPKLQEYFNDATLQLTPKTCIFDYEGEKKFIELKKRTFNSDKYPDTMIGVNKIEYCKGKEAASVGQGRSSCTGYFVKLDFLV